MYAYSYDKLAGTMVGVLARPFTEDADNQRLLESIAKHQEDAAGPSAQGIFILAVDPQYPQPNAKWRRKFAESRDGVRFAKTYFAVVTPEASLRGVLVAVNWIRPPTDRLVADTFATFDEAVRWADERRGKAATSLRRLMEDVQEKLGFAAESASSVRAKNAAPPPSPSHTGSFAPPAHPSTPAPPPSVDKSHASLEKTHPSLEKTHPSLEKTHPSLEKTHPSLEKSHASPPTEKPHAPSPLAGQRHSIAPPPEKSAPHK